jgi:hypothetical protein
MIFNEKVLRILPANLPSLKRWAPPLAMAEGFLPSLSNIAKWLANCQAFPTLPCDQNAPEKPNSNQKTTVPYNLRDK